MNVVERLQKMLCECLGICVPQEEIAVESVQLYWIRFENNVSKRIEK